MAHRLRRGSLGVIGISFFVISAAAPLTAMAGGAPVAMLLGNGPGIPAAYIVVSLLLLVFSVGYTAMALASFAVVVFLRRNPGLGGKLWRTLIAPVVGGVATALVAIYAASQFGLLIGDETSPLSWALPALILVAAAAGIVSSLMLKSKDVSLYAEMGRNRE
ncbi:hypothetical protein JIG36_03430 [Actinoplanes sp. LDG1-06]|uniref:Amino acid permease n=1 Tax=Paractinoplanes ovalisporus TaxID=2810368 RepID=A0ABS2A427_9ACTN|nr:hypothetical protein [Actinoplanes ovalisporus]MBM2614605.1 hypothetical protein [Actinoplanes ovalisporus]